VTLFHWDYPMALYNRGGWLNRDSVEWFGDYSSIVAGALGDRVKHWMTLNEPPCFTFLGNHMGVHAPGDNLPIGLFPRILHHVLMAHGRSVQAIRAHSPQKASIGLAANNSGASIPVTESAADIEAARRHYFKVDSQLDFRLALWTDPIYLGRYPESAYKVYAPDMPEPSAEDMALIHQPVDFLGYNCYSGTYIRAGENGEPEDVPFEPGNPIGTLTWLQMAPDALYWAARFQTERYGALPFVVTENGYASRDWVHLDGKVHDPNRIDYAHRYLLGLKRAAAEGIPLAGYFHWSIMDNFEWAEGHKERCGLIHVDYHTQKRTLKDSAYWYREVIRSNGNSL